MIVPEREYVDECPVCGTALIGMSPDEVRSIHADDCNTLLGLMVFPESNDE